jgi:hypothetical protein
MSAFPVSTYQGELTVLGVTLRMHVLDDGTRVIEKGGIDELFATMAEDPLDQDDADRLAKFIKGPPA